MPDGIVAAPNLTFRACHPEAMSPQLLPPHDLIGARTARIDAWGNVFDLPHLGPEPRGWSFRACHPKATSSQLLRPHDLIGVRTARIDAWGTSLTSHTSAQRQGAGRSEHAIQKPCHLSCCRRMISLARGSLASMPGGTDLTSHLWPKGKGPVVLGMPCKALSSQLLPPHDLLGARVARVNARRNRCDPPPWPERHANSRDLRPLPVPACPEVLRRVQPALPGVRHVGEALLPIVLPVLQLRMDVLLHGALRCLARYVITWTACAWTAAACMLSTEEHIATGVTGLHHDVSTAMPAGQLSPHHHRRSHRPRPSWNSSL